MGRENDREGFIKAETNRQKFRLYCNLKLNLDFTIESLKTYLSKDEWKKDLEFVHMLDQEEILKTFYRWHILKHDFETIQKDKKIWKLEV
jgi:hypothetical protein